MRHMIFYMKYIAQNKLSQVSNQNQFFEFLRIGLTSEIRSFHWFRIR